MNSSPTATSVRPVKGHALKSNTDLQHDFVEHYVLHGDAVKAAQAAGYNSGRSLATHETVYRTTAKRLLANPKIQALIEKERSRVQAERA